MPLSATSRPFAASLSERIELVKWLAVLLMLWDHSKYVYPLPGWEFLGRGALPLFALAFGYSLTVAPDLRGLLTRLLFCGFAAEVAGAWVVTGGGKLNIMFLFAACTWLAYARRAGASPVGYLLRWAVVVVLSPLFEYSLWGVVLVVACTWYWGRPSPRRALVVGVVSLLLVVPNYSFWATWFLPVGMGLAHWSPTGLPRIRRALYFVYAGQWPLLWVLS